MRLRHIEPNRARFLASESMADRLIGRRWVRFCSSPVFGSRRRLKEDFLFTARSYSDLWPRLLGPVTCREDVIGDLCFRNGSLAVADYSATKKVSRAHPYAVVLGRPSTVGL